MRFRDLKKQSTKNNKTKDTKPNVKYATYPDRIKAFITDMFMIYIPIMFIITYAMLNGKDDLQASEFGPLFGTTMYGVVYAIFLSKLGQTPGKKAYEMKVVNYKTYQNIGFFRAFFRFFAFLFTASTLLGLFLPLFRKDKRALHDLLTGTVIVALED
ncbi:RDD family protein [Sulfurimonas sp.]